MATRFYLPPSRQPALSPAFGAWTRSTDGLRRTLHHPTKEGVAHANRQIVKTTATNPANVAISQYISRPLRAGNVSGTVKGIIQCFCGTASVAKAQTLIRILSGDLTTVRGTLLALDATAISNAFGTTIQNRKFPVNWAGAGTSLTLVAAQEGDVIVIEFGVRAYTASTSTTFTFRFGDDPTLADLAENETDTADGVPWFEFSQDLAFFGDAKDIKANPRGFVLESLDPNYLSKIPGRSVDPTGGSNSVSNVPRNISYQLRSETVVPGTFVYWVNTTGDDIGKPAGGVGATQIVSSWST